MGGKVTKWPSYAEKNILRARKSLEFVRCRFWYFVRGCFRNFHVFAFAKAVNWCPQKEKPRTKYWIRWRNGIATLRIMSLSMGGLSYEKFTFGFGTKTRL